MNIKIRPLHNRVLIKRVTAQLKTAGGLIIPDNAQEKPIEGEVLAVGAKAEGLAVGNVVLFGKYSGNEIQMDGEEFLIIGTDDILGVIER